MDLLFVISDYDHAIRNPYGGIAYFFRFFHRWFMLLFGPILVIYILHLLSNRQLREGLERIDYAEFAILLVFTVYGISDTWNLDIWGTYLKDFGVSVKYSDYNSQIFLPTTPIHVLLVYAWVILSLIGGGHLRKALANIYLQFPRRGLSPKVIHPPLPNYTNPTS